MNIQHSIHIEKTVGEVFDYFTEIENLVDWIEGLHYLEVLEGEEAGIGGKSKQIIKQNGKTLHFTQVIIGFEINELFEAKMKSKEMSIHVKYTFEEAEEGTNLYVEQDIKLHSFLLRSGKGIVKVLMQNIMESDFETLKNILENGEKEG
jgi:hypothetical protein